MSDVRGRVQEIFRDVFHDPTIELKDEMTASDIDDWTSLAHITLIVAIEKGLNIKFATAEISRLKAAGENVGSLLRCIETKLVKA